MNRALLVGINKYANPKISSLNGCLEDVSQVKSFLEAGKVESFFDIKMLLNEQASRARIINAFEEFLADTPPGKIAFFYYSGHGARETSDEGVKTAKLHGGDMENETIVCYDSRTEANPYDLADKELAQLINLLAQRKIEVVVMLDCCHSGSGTRLFNVKAKRLTKVNDRPSDSYYGSDSSRSIIAPSAKHLLLSACRKDEYAWECPVDGKSRGIFTYKLFKALEKDPNLSYTQLYEYGKVAIQYHEMKQQPQMECFEYFDPNQLFLKQIVLNDPKTSYSLFLENGFWWIRLGWMHGLALYTKSEQTFSVYHKEDTPKNQLLDKARIAEVYLDKSRLELAYSNGSTISKEYPKDYIAYPIHVDVDKLPIYTQEPSSLPHPLKASNIIYFVEEANQADYELLYEEGQFILSYRKTGEILVKRSQPIALDNELKKIRQWERTLDLVSKEKFISPGQQIIASQIGQQKEIFSTQAIYITLDLLIDEEQIPYRISTSFKSSGENQVYVNLMYLSRTFSIKPVFSNFIKGNNINYTLLDTALSINDPHLYQVFDIFKLIISKEQVDSFFLSQNEISDSSENPQIKRKRADQAAISLDPLAQNWQTHTISVRTFRELGKIGNESLSILGGKVQFQAHPTFTAGVNVSSPLPCNQGPIEEYVLYQTLIDDGLELVDWSDDDKKIYILELHNIECSKSLRNNPLKCMLTYPHNDADELFPLTYDGEKFWRFPIQQTTTHTHELLIPFIPKNPDDGRMVKGRSLKLFFVLLPQKTIQQLREKNMWSLDENQMKALVDE